MVLRDWVVASVVVCLSSVAIAGEPGGLLASARAAVKSGQTVRGRELFGKALRRHEEERSRAAVALLEWAELEESSGELEESARLLRKLTAMFPGRQLVCAKAENRLRALREGGGLFLQTLLARERKARGGTRLEAVKSVAMSGRLVLGGESQPFRRRLTFAPLRVREDAPSAGVAKGWSGRRGWIRKGGRVEVLEGPRLDRTVAWARGVVAELLGRRAGRPRFMGHSRVEGRESYHLEWRVGGERWREDWSVTSGLPMRAEGLALDAKGRKAQMTVYFRGWKSWSGIWLPGRVDYYDGERLAYSFVYESYILDSEIDPKVFNGAVGKE